MPIRLFLIICIFISAFCAAPAYAELPDPHFEVVAELEQGPGNIAVTPEGRIIISQHQFYDAEYRVVEVLPEGSVKPFPNEGWSTAPSGEKPGLHAVLGIVCDARGIVWMLDNGGGKGMPKLLGWDTRTDKLHKVIYIPAPAAGPKTFLNDLAVDLKHDTAYIADIGGEREPAIVVVNLISGASRRVLAGHKLVSTQDLPMVIDGEMVTRGKGDQASRASLGINPITIDPSYNWVYFGAMHGDDVLRVRTMYLLDETLSEEELAERIHRYGPKPVSDGISIDAGGYVYVTDVTNKAIGVTTPMGEYKIYVMDERLLWPDGIAAGPDGYFYATVNKLHRSAFLNAGKNESEPPYYIVRFKAIAGSVVGR